MNKNPLNYKDSGVDIHKSNIFVKHLKKIAKKTSRPEVIQGPGGFAALCAIPKNYREPILVSSTDGVGTKIKLAMQFKFYETIGIDVVAMCVNDIIVLGAEPLFFLDYYATNHIKINTISSIIDGITKGCLKSGCSLIGGETAEMPGIYKGEDYDIAGFCVGIVEKEKIINGKKIKDGDILIALSSSGPHANGYSLINKIINDNNIDIQKTYIRNKPLIDDLLQPTRIYVKNILTLIEEIELNAIVHITGGGFWDNIPRVLPDHTQAILNESAWEWPEIFKWIQKSGNISRFDMYHTFNCGVGMIIALHPSVANKALKKMTDYGETAWKIGVIKASSSSTRVVINP
ncbi:phosphoribosylformylglycinamidine cyclo-ligase [Candidatus Erwinia haradaeae]|uniref:Phosphoribosylformylglycinamidine cyclo-ligase n=1 Tax=Candidatus Erwinia haradaeae TaxID=1922217 RepID=A0A451D2P4_9GAMM|nr:phosphoribosylformylglycinamidine cyclo-ligase [Candidatus Erwinia haradaeae]VFP79935.1 Phosphoribosylformylglycinamidine cyclo-ligase [Candidatus Erwinia haradaeae]